MEDSMGKGDKRTRRGKIYKGSYGRVRPRRIKRDTTGVAPTKRPTRRPPRRRKSGYV
jgi:30S ribosomal protein S31